MFWILVLILIAGDGTKNVQTKIEPTQQACAGDAVKLLKDISVGRPDELVGVGVKCDGPLQDPTIPKQKV